MILSNWLYTQNLLLQTQYHGIEEGLSHRDVQAIYQDDRGLLWVGTKQGLNRFDGYQFKPYIKESHQLQSNKITHILGDKQGNLWLFDTESYFLKSVFSISVFDPVLEVAYSLEQYLPKGLPFAVRDIIGFNQNQDRNFVFFTKKNEIFLYDKEFKKIDITLFNFHKLENIHWAPSGLIWLNMRILKADGTSSLQLLAMNPEGKIVHDISHPGYHDLFIHKLDKEGNCHYLATKSFQYSKPYILGNDGQIKNDTSISNNPLLVQHLYQDQIINSSTFKRKKGYCWIANKSLSIFSQHKKIDSQSHPALEQIKSATCIFFDRQSTVWIGTPFGLYQLQLGKNKFHRLLYKIKESNIPTRNICLDHNDQLWVIEEGTLNLWGIDLKQKVNFTINTSEIIQNNVKIKNSFNAIITSKDSSLYFVSGDDLIRIHPIMLEAQYIPIRKHGQNWALMWALHEDENNNIWFASENGDIGCWDGENVFWLPIVTDNPPKYIYHFAPDKFGKTWIATDRGLLLLDINSKKIIAQYFSGGKGKYHLPFDNIYHIYHDPDGSLWLGTGGNGLVHWNKGAPLMDAPLSTADKDSSTYFQQFSISSGLNNTIYAVYEDDNGQLWLPSDYGIIRFNKHTNRIKTYLEVDGITHHEFNRVSHFEAADGRLFFGSLDGVTMFHPKDFQEDSLVTNFPLIITAFHLIDQDGNQSQEARQKLLKNHTITYQPDDRLFRIEFALLTYENAAKVRYAYKLEGIEKGWNYQNEHFIRFSRLPYGNYNLRIKGQGAYGQWSNRELTIKLSIIKPFYLRFWFIALSIFCIAAMIIFYFRWRNAKLIQRQQFLEAEVNRQTQKIRQQAEELKSLEKLKSRFFANVSHELRTPLSLMLGPIDSLLHKNYDKEKSHQFLRFIFKNCQHLLKLVNEILDLSKLEKGILEVSPSLIHFHSFLQRLLTQFGSIGDSKAILFDYKYHCDIDLHLFLDTDKFEKIIHNYLSNAIKFTPKGGTISMVVTEKENQILISVKDSGLGIHPEDLPYIFDRFYQSKRSERPIQGGTGIGLSLCKELAELLDGNVWAESKIMEGSIFYFQFAMVKATTNQVEQSIEDNFYTLDEASFSNKTVSNKSIPPPLSLSQQLKSVEDTTSLIAVPDTLRRPTILVVEDNTDLRNYLSSILDENFKVKTAENGKEALALIHAQQKNESIDLIISDLMMPVMDGFQFLEAVKQEDKLRHIPVIMLTARANVRVKLKALRIGIDDYLVKPFIEAELILRIQNLLDNLHKRILLFANASTNLHNNTKKPILSEVDANWLKEVEAAFTKIIPDAQLHLDWVADHLFISKKQLTRRIKQLTGLTPNKYIREMRLQLARDYLYVGKYHTVKEVAIAVGFSDTKYFSKLFQERFGILPSEQLN